MFGMKYIVTWQETSLSTVVFQRFRTKSKAKERVKALMLKGCPYVKMEAVLFQHGSAYGMNRG